MGPERPLYWFRKLCAIPHPSGQTKEISDFILAFAAENGLEARQDQWNNLVIRKPASPGYAEHAPVMLQAHMDMVCEKKPDCNLDMTREGLRLRTEGDWLFAEGTTLGADDGYGVATAMAILEDRTLAHPPLEVVLTTDEETGMYGAAGLDTSDLQSRRMLNLDTEDEGVFIVSCAGGLHAECILPAEYTPNTAPAVTIAIADLKGGHSGDAIHIGRANAIQLMGRMLSKLGPHRLVSLTATGKENAIARNCTAVVTTDAPAALMAEVQAFGETLKGEYAVSDPDMTVTAVPAVSEKAMTPETTAACEAFLLLAPHGVQNMSLVLKGLVQTSLNPGVMTTDENGVWIGYSVRSALSSQKTMLSDRLTALAEKLGGRAELSASYPAWEYCADSPLRELAVELYTERYGTAPRVIGTHGGLECGILCGKIPGLDILSYGPKIPAIHTPGERISLSSWQRTWDFTLELLKRC